MAQAVKSYNQVQHKYMCVIHLPSLSLSISTITEDLLAHYFITNILLACNIN